MSWRMLSRRGARQRRYPFGHLLSQMANFLDQAGGLLVRRVLNGKVGGAFASTATQHGGQEMTLFSIIANQSPALRHDDCRPRLRPCPQMTLDEIIGGSPDLPATMARACLQRTSSREPATRAARSRRPQTSYTTKAFSIRIGSNCTSGWVPCDA